jgi:hypothetical protein
MLEQRRAEEKGYITLKEAAKIANYTPDYIGQLIRAGKIKGEQVYSNVAWVTTENEINSYLTDKGRVISDSEKGNFFSDILLKYFLYAVIALTAVVILSLQYILYVSIDTHLNESYLSHTTTESTDS